MTLPTLLISHPPHGEVDAAAAAPYLGLAAPDLVLKANYQIPEIWAAEEEEAKVRTIAVAARQAGFKVSLVSGPALMDVATRHPLQRVSVADRGVDLVAEGRRMELGWDAELIGVYYTPRAGGGVAKDQPVRAVKERGASCDAPFFDLYLAKRDSAERLAVLTDLTAFSGLGESKSMSPAGRVARFVQVCEERFTTGQVDRRLVNMQIRHWPPPASLAAKQLLRKGYSFASAGLAELLAKFGPDMAEPSHCELASRLVYLTLRYGEVV